MIMMGKLVVLIIMLIFMAFAGLILRSLDWLQNKLNDTSTSQDKNLKNPQQKKL